MIRFREGTSGEEDMKVTGGRVTEGAQSVAENPGLLTLRLVLISIPWCIPLSGEGPRRGGELWRAGNLQLVRFGIRASLQTTTA